MAAIEFRHSAADGVNPKLATYTFRIASNLSDLRSIHDTLDEFAHILGVCFWLNESFARTSDMRREAATRQVAL